jgi:predicted nucleic acid-binding protein
LTSGFLLDTSVLSLLAPGRPEPDDGLTTWLRENNDRIYISAVTMAEVEQSICKLRRAGGGERAEALTQWLDALLNDGADRILSLDANVGRIAGGLSDKATATGRHPVFADVAIAATAVAHGLTIVTRNGRHFAALDVAFVDPVDKLPGR